MHCAFRRTCDIMLKRRKKIAKILGLKPKLLKDPSPSRAQRLKRLKAKTRRRVKRKPKKLKFIKRVD